MYIYIYLAAYLPDASDEGYCALLVMSSYTSELEVFQ